MFNNVYTPDHSPKPTLSERASHAAVFLIALALVVGLTQFIAPFDSEGRYEVTLQERFVR